MGKYITDVNMGIDPVAKNYLMVHTRHKQKIDEGATRSGKSLLSRTGTIGSVELHSYKMSDGTIAEEFIQAVLKTGDGKKLFFLGLKVHGKSLIWPTSELREKTSAFLRSI